MSIAPERNPGAFLVYSFCERVGGQATPKKNTKTSKNALLTKFLDNNYNYYDSAFMRGGII
jgi:hypothetical protein